MPNNLLFDFVDFSLEKLTPDVISSDGIDVTNASCTRTFSDTALWCWKQKEKGNNTPTFARILSMYMTTQKHSTKVCIKVVLSWV